MDTEYHLIIYDFGESDKSTKIITSVDGNTGYCIKKLKYEKGLYSPCSVEMEISATDSPENINSVFASKSADLKVSNSGAGEAYIFKNYIVYQFKIVSEKSTITLHLTLFSRDKLLTLNKFSRVYLNHRLGQDIIQKSLLYKLADDGEVVADNSGYLGKCKVDFLTDGLNRLQFLCHTSENGTYELIQPYRVQYNEDFYSFISRVACQCGEILYFENGKLTLGPDPASVPSAIAAEDISRIEYPTVVDPALKVDDCHWNYLANDEVPVLAEDSGLQFSDNGAFDEYFDVLDKSGPDKGEFYLPDVINLALKKFIPAVAISAADKSTMTFFERSPEWLKDTASIAATTCNSRNYVNDKVKDEVFEHPEDNTEYFDSARQTMDDNGEKLSQFADVKEDAYGKLLHDKLSAIREMEIVASKEKIIIQLDTVSSAQLWLGKRVTIGNSNNNEANKTYVVTACRGDFSIMDANDEKDITEIEIVPLQDGIFVPPYDKCAEYSPVQSQVAVVSDDYDPRFLGRVRIRYPWQIGKKGSPWVRVLTPFSSKSDCIHFRPNEGDEVMVGYIGGNVERPYVIGSLFGKDAMNIHDSLYSANNNTIKVGSQRLDFRKGTVSSLISSFVPGFTFITQLFPGSFNWLTDLDTEKVENLIGSTKLTDVNSLWKIEGNTANRSITIDSALGKVTISAYTGISIEAVGDVSIKGNNISIQAQNNVTIESGLALKNYRRVAAEYKKKSWMDVAAGVGTGLLSDLLFVDLSLVRTVWESCIPPKEGTLKIKSNRYLMMEAGSKGFAFDNTIEEGERFASFVPNKDSSIRGYMKDLRELYAAVYKLGRKRNATTIIEALKNDLMSEIRVLQEQRVNLATRDANLISSEYETNSTADGWTDYATVSGLVSGQNTNSNIRQAASRWISKVGNLMEIKELVSNFDAQLQIIDEPYQDLIREEADNNEVIDQRVMSDLYKRLCAQYLIAKKGKLFTVQEMREDTVQNALTVINSLAVVDDNKKLSDKIKDTIKESFNKEYRSQLYTNSDYDVPVFYYEGAMKELKDGKIIMSYTADKSLEVKDDGSLKPMENLTFLETIKNECLREFPDLNR